MAGSETFEVAKYLATAGPGRKLLRLPAKVSFFSQGGASDAVFDLHTGRARLTVVGKSGKMATITLLNEGEFIGEEAVAGIPGPRLATATALTACSALRISRREMLHVLHEEHAFSDFCLAFVLVRSMRTQADLVDQLFNSSEKRLARILLLMAQFGHPGKPQMLIPYISQETLADMSGTTRSRVSFFMNRFRKLGLLNTTGAFT